MQKHRSEIGYGHCNYVNLSYILRDSYAKKEPFRISTIFPYPIFKMNKKFKLFNFYTQN